MWIEPVYSQLSGGLSLKDCGFCEATNDLFCYVVIRIFLGGPSYEGKTPDAPMSAIFGEGTPSLRFPDAQAVAVKPK